MWYLAALDKGDRTAPYTAGCVVRGSNANVRTDQRGHNAHHHNLSNTRLSLHKDPRDVVQTSLQRSTCQL